MCVAFITIGGVASSSSSNDDADDAVVLAFNRDERLSRETLAAHAFPGEDIIAGKDVRGGGTWLGVNKNTGAFALLTNASVIGAREREGADDDDVMGDDSAVAAPSMMMMIGGEQQVGARRASDGTPYRTRGELVTEYLRAECECVETYAKEVFERRFAYDAFNLIVGNHRGTAYYVGNRGDANHHGPMQLRRGRVYGLANDNLDAPGWIKVERGKAAMEKILAERRADGGDAPRHFQPLEEAILRDVLHAPFLDDDTSSSDGSRTYRQRYRAVECHPKHAKSAFVRAGEIPGAPDVVTRSSTVVVLARDGRASWREANWDPLHTNTASSGDDGRDSPSSSSEHRRAAARVHAFVFRVPETRRPKSLDRGPTSRRAFAA